MKFSGKSKADFSSRSKSVLGEQGKETGLAFIVVSEWDWVRGPICIIWTSHQALKKGASGSLICFDRYGAEGKG